MNAERPPDALTEIQSPHDPNISPHFIRPPQSLANSYHEATKGVRILIAEDDPVSREILANRLVKWGYDVIITHDGREAMAAMRAANAPALAVLDWMMPGMDGIEVCRRLRDASKAVYIILLTSLGTKENILQALEVGADDYLVKPFDAFALQTRIRVGLRIIGLQTVLADRVKELESAAVELKDMRSRLHIPI